VDPPPSPGEDVPFASAVHLNLMKQSKEAENCSPTNNYSGIL